MPRWDEVEQVNEATWNAREDRIAELESALKPFVAAFEQFAKQEACTRVLSLGQLGRLAAGEVSGAHFKTACQALTKSD